MLLVRERLAESRGELEHGQLGTGESVALLPEEDVWRGVAVLVNSLGTPSVGRIFQSIAVLTVLDPVL
jgi:hypothetical protein